VPQFINRQVISASLLFVYKQSLTCASRILEKMAKHVRSISEKRER